MAKVRISAMAREELEEIWLFIAPDSVRFADRLLETLCDEIRKLGQRPGMGRSRDEIEVGIRSWPSGNYVIYYREVGNVVEILHIAHGAQAIERLIPRKPQK